MRIRWTPIEAVCKTVTEASGGFVSCWVEHCDGSVAAGTRPDNGEEISRRTVQIGRENAGEVGVCGQNAERWLSLLHTCVSSELAHQNTVSDMADATARLWKHTNALIRMAASTKIALDPAAILDKVLGILARSTALGVGTGIVRLPDQEEFTQYHGEESSTVAAALVEPLEAVGEDVRIVSADDQSADLRKACTELTNADTAVAVVRLATESDQLGFLVAPIEDGETVTSEELKVLVSAAQIVSVAIENGYTLNRAMESTRLEVENKLLEDRNADMEEMVHVVAHDLRSPMTALYGFVHVALDELKDLRDSMEGKGFGNIGKHAELIAEPLRDGIRSVEKLNRMVQRLLDFSRAARGAYSFETIELEPLVTGVVRSLRYQLTKNEIESDVSELPTINGDRVQVEAVFGNLVDNAIKYMGDGPVKRIEIGARQDGEELVYFVRDTGVGMNEDQVSKAFLPFQRFHGDAAPGDGIGLPHVRKIVERHGGRIWCESIEGRGSTFFFTLGESVVETPKKQGRLAQTAARVARGAASAGTTSA